MFQERVRPRIHRYRYRVRYRYRHITAFHELSIESPAMSTRLGTEATSSIQEDAWERVDSDKRSR